MHKHGDYSWRCWCDACCRTRRNGLIVGLSLLTAFVVGITTAGWNWYDHF